MSNMQFYIAVAIPSILVILAWIQSNSRASDLKENVNRQFEEMNRRMNRQLSRSTGSSSKSIAASIGIDEDLKHFHNVTDVLEGRMDELSRK